MQVTGIDVVVAMQHTVARTAGVAAGSDALVRDWKKLLVLLVGAVEDGELLELLFLELVLLVADWWDEQRRHEVASNGQRLVAVLSRAFILDEDMQVFSQVLEARQGSFCEFVMHI